MESPRKLLRSDKENVVPPSSPATTTPATGGGDTSPTTPRPQPHNPRVPNAPSRPRNPNAWGHGNGNGRGHRHRPALRLTQVMAEQQEQIRQPLFADPLTPPAVEIKDEAEPLNVTAAFHASFHATRRMTWSLIQRAASCGHTDCLVNVPLELVNVGVLREFVRRGYALFPVDQNPAPASGTGTSGDNRPMKYVLTYLIDWSLLLLPPTTL